MKVLAIVLDGFEELEGIASFALLRRAKIQLDITSLSNQVTGAHNISLNNLVDLNKIKIENYDCLLLPGGGHYKLIESNQNIINIIKYFMDNNKVVAAICASPTILGRLGYLKNRNYTCFTSMNEDFGGTYLNDYTVTDGNLITGKSAAASIDFAFAIINKIGGKNLEDKIKNEIYY